MDQDDATNIGLGKLCRLERISLRVERIEGRGIYYLNDAAKEARAAT